jgi:glyoxylase I family protein
MPDERAARSLHHLALGTRDVERLARFYREAFGLIEVKRQSGEGGELRSIWLDLGGALLMIEASVAPARPVVEGVGAGLFLLAMRVPGEERAAFEQRLEQLGQPIESRTEFTSYARDPDGNRIALSHYPDPPTADFRIA